MKRFLFLICLICSFVCVSPVSAQPADFEDLSLNPESYWNGSDASGGFVSGGVEFSNNYDSTYGSWDGFAYSNITDTAADGFDAQYNAIPGHGADNSEIYAVCYVTSFAASPPAITLSTEMVVSGAYFTNNNYAYYAMARGDAFSKKFTDEDWFKLTITGLDAEGEETGKVDFKLANGTDIVNEWTWVDLNELGSVKQLTFSLSSTDNGDYGMNTPAYFCMDNFDKKKSSDDSSCFIWSAGHFLK